ncbi:hypothetical protein [Dactylosporangium sp. CA-233914]|uniref:hypothetical protein n=1 Tax=Dactylosporangium sp. CA-233914 TaxID=3239934 RepID=UPI003D901307
MPVGDGCPEILVVAGRLVLTGGLVQVGDPVALAASVAADQPVDAALVFLVEEVPRSAVGLGFVRGQPFGDQLVLVPWGIERWEVGDAGAVEQLADLYGVQVQVPVGLARSGRLVGVDGSGREVVWEGAVAVRGLPWSHVAAREAVREAARFASDGAGPSWGRLELFVGVVGEVQQRLRVAVPSAALAFAVYLARFAVVSEVYAGELARKVMPVSAADLLGVVGGGLVPVGAVDALVDGLLHASGSAALVSFGSGGLAWLMAGAGGVLWWVGGLSGPGPVATRVVDDWRLAALGDPSTAVLVVGPDGRATTVAELRGDSGLALSDLLPFRPGQDVAVRPQELTVFTMTDTELKDPARAAVAQFEQIVAAASDDLPLLVRRLTEFSAEFSEPLAPVGGSGVPFLVDLPAPEAGTKLRLRLVPGEPLEALEGVSVIDDGDQLWIEVELDRAGWEGLAWVVSAAGGEQARAADAEIEVRAEDDPLVFSFARLGLDAGGVQALVLATTLMAATPGLWVAFDALGWLHDGDRFVARRDAASVLSTDFGRLFGQVRDPRVRGQLILVALAAGAESVAVPWDRGAASVSGRPGPVDGPVEAIRTPVGPWSPVVLLPSEPPVDASRGAGAATGAPTPGRVAVLAMELVRQHAPGLTAVRWEVVAPRRMDAPAVPGQLSAVLADRELTMWASAGLLESGVMVRPEGGGPNGRVLLMVRGEAPGFEQYVRMDDAEQRHHDADEYRAPLLVTVGLHAGSLDAGRITLEAAAGLPAVGSVLMELHAAKLESWPRLFDLADEFGVDVFKLTPFMHALSDEGRLFVRELETRVDHPSPDAGLRQVYLPELEDLANSIVRAVWRKESEDVVVEVGRAAAESAVLFLPDMGLTRFEWRAALAEAGRAGLTEAGQWGLWLTGVLGLESTSSAQAHQLVHELVGDGATKYLDTPEQLADWLGLDRSALSALSARLRVSRRWVTAFSVRIGRVPDDVVDLASQLGVREPVQLFALASMLGVDPRVLGAEDDLGQLNADAGPGRSGRFAAAERVADAIRARPDWPERRLAGTLTDHLFQIVRHTRTAPDLDDERGWLGLPLLLEVAARLEVPPRLVVAYANLNPAPTSAGAGQAGPDEVVAAYQEWLRSVEQRFGLNGEDMGRVWDRLGSDSITRGDPAAVHAVALQHAGPERESGVFGRIVAHAGEDPTAAIRAMVAVQERGGWAPLPVPLVPDAPSPAGMSFSITSESEEERLLATTRGQVDRNILERRWQLEERLSHLPGVVVAEHEGRTEVRYEFGPGRGAWPGLSVVLDALQQEDSGFRRMRVSVTTGYGTDAAAYLRLAHLYYTNVDVLAAIGLAPSENYRIDGEVYALPRWGFSTFAGFLRGHQRGALQMSVAWRSDDLVRFTISPSQSLVRPGVLQTQLRIIAELVELARRPFQQPDVWDWRFQSPGHRGSGAPDMIGRLVGLLADRSVRAQAAALLFRARPHPPMRAYGVAPPEPVVSGLGPVRDDPTIVGEPPQAPEMPGVAELDGVLAEDTALAGLDVGELTARLNDPSLGMSYREAVLRAAGPDEVFAAGRVPGDQPVSDVFRQLVAGRLALPDEAVRAAYRAASRKDLEDLLQRDQGQWAALMLSSATVDAFMGRPGEWRDDALLAVDAGAADGYRDWPEPSGIVDWLLRRIGSGEPLVPYFLTDALGGLAGPGSGRWFDLTIEVWLAAGGGSQEDDEPHGETWTLVEPSERRARVGDAVAAAQEALDRAGLTARLQIVDVVAPVEHNFNVQATGLVDSPPVWRALGSVIETVQRHGGRTIRFMEVRIASPGPVDASAVELREQAQTLQSLLVNHDDVLRTLGVVGTLSVDTFRVRSTGELQILTWFPLDSQWGLAGVQVPLRVMFGLMAAAERVARPGPAVSTMPGAGPVGADVALATAAREQVERRLLDLPGGRQLAALLAELQLGPAHGTQVVALSRFTDQHPHNHDPVRYSDEVGFSGQLDQGRLLLSMKLRNRLDAAPVHQRGRIRLQPPPEGQPSVAERSAFEVRRIVVGGELHLTEVTINLRFRPSAAAGRDITMTWFDTFAAVDKIYNPVRRALPDGTWAFVHGEPLPNGDLLKVRVNWRATDDVVIHHEIATTGAAVDQNTWLPGRSADVYAHEIGHMLGLPHEASRDALMHPRTPIEGRHDGAGGERPGVALTSLTLRLFELVVGEVPAAAEPSIADSVVTPPLRPGDHVLPAADSDAGPAGVGGLRVRLDAAPVYQRGRIRFQPPEQPRPVAERSAFEVRRVSVDGGYLTELTINVRFRVPAAGGAAAEAAEKIFNPVRHELPGGLWVFVNGERLPNGDLWRVRVNRVTAVGVVVHHEVDTTGVVADQNSWPPGLPADVYAHEVGHMLGLPHEPGRDALMHPRTPGPSGERPGVAVTDLSRRILALHIGEVPAARDSSTADNVIQPPLRHGDHTLPMAGFQPAGAGVEDFRLFRTADPALHALIREQVRQDYPRLFGPDDESRWRAWEGIAGLIAAEAGVPAPRGWQQTVHRGHFSARLWQVSLGIGRPLDHTVRGLVHEMLHVEQKAVTAWRFGEVYAEIGDFAVREELQRRRPADDPRYPAADRLRHSSPSPAQQLWVSKAFTLLTGLTRRTMGRVERARGLGQVGPRVRRRLEEGHTRAFAALTVVQAMYYADPSEAQAFQMAMVLANEGSMRNYHLEGGALRSALARFGPVPLGPAGFFLPLPSSKAPPQRPAHPERPLVVLDVEDVEYATVRLGALRDLLPDPTLVELIPTVRLSAPDVLKLARALGDRHELAIGRDLVDAAGAPADHLVGYTRAHQATMRQFAGYYTVHTAAQRRDVEVVDMFTLKALGEGTYGLLPGWLAVLVGDRVWIGPAGSPPRVEDGDPQVVIGGPDQDTPWTVWQYGMWVARALAGHAGRVADAEFVHVHRPASQASPRPWPLLESLHAVTEHDRRLLDLAFGELPAFAGMPAFAVYYLTDALLDMAGADPQERDLATLVAVLDQYAESLPALSGEAATDPQAARRKLLRQLWQDAGTFYREMAEFEPGPPPVVAAPGMSRPLSEELRVRLDAAPVYQRGRIRFQPPEQPRPVAERSAFEVRRIPVGEGLHLTEVTVNVRFGGAATGGADVALAAVEGIFNPVRHALPDGLWVSVNAEPLPNGDLWRVRVNRVTADDAVVHHEVDVTGSTADQNTWPPGLPVDVYAHEVGHMLGLPHEPGRDALMHPRTPGLAGERPGVALTDLSRRLLALHIGDVPATPEHSTMDHVVTPPLRQGDHVLPQAGSWPPPYTVGVFADGSYAVAKPPQYSAQRPRPVTTDGSRPVNAAGWHGFSGFFIYSPEGVPRGSYDADFVEADDFIAVSSLHNHSDVPGALDLVTFFATEQSNKPYFQFVGVFNPKLWPLLSDDYRMTLLPSSPESLRGYRARRTVMNDIVRKRLQESGWILAPDGGTGTTPPFGPPRDADGRLQETVPLTVAAVFPHSDVRYYYEKAREIGWISADGMSERAWHGLKRLTGLRSERSKAFEFIHHVLSRGNGRVRKDLVLPGYSVFRNTVRGQVVTARVLSGGRTLKVDGGWHPPIRRPLPLDLILESRDDDVILEILDRFGFQVEISRDNRFQPSRTRGGTATVYLDPLDGNGSWQVLQQAYSALLGLTDVEDRRLFRTADPALHASVREWAHQHYALLTGRDGDESRWRAWKAVAGLIAERVGVPQLRDLVLVDSLDIPSEGLFSVAEWNVSLSGGMPLDQTLRVLVHQMLHVEHAAVAAWRSEDAYARIIDDGVRESLREGRPDSDPRYQAFERLGIGTTGPDDEARSNWLSDGYHHLIGLHEQMTEQLNQSVLGMRVRRRLGSGASVVRMAAAELQATRYSEPGLKQALQLDLAFEAGGSMRDYHREGTALADALAGLAPVSLGPAGFFLPLTPSAAPPQRVVHPLRPLVVVEVADFTQARRRLGELWNLLPEPTLVELLFPRDVRLSATDVLELAGALGDVHELAIGKDQVDAAWVPMDHFVAYTWAHQATMRPFAGYYTAHVAPQRRDIQVGDMFTLQALGGGRYEMLPEWEVAVFDDRVQIYERWHRARTPDNELRVVIGDRFKDTPWTVWQYGVWVARVLAGHAGTAADERFVRVYRPEPVASPWPWPSPESVHSVTRHDRQLIEVAFGDVPELDDAPPFAVYHLMDGLLDRAGANPLVTSPHMLTPTLDRYAESQRFVPRARTRDPEGDRREIRRELLRRFWMEEGASFRAVAEFRHHHLPPLGTKPGDAKPGDAKPGDAKPGDAKPAEPATPGRSPAAVDTATGSGAPVEEPQRDRQDLVTRWAEHQGAWPDVSSTFLDRYLAPQSDRTSRRSLNDDLLRMMYVRWEFRELAVDLARGVVEREQPVEGRRSGFDYGLENAKVFAAVDRVLRMSVTSATDPDSSEDWQEAIKDVTGCVLDPYDKVYWVTRLDELRNRVLESGIPGHPERDGVGAPEHAKLLELLTQNLSNC